MTATGRHRFAMYWAGSCGGCDIAVLNLNEAILDIDEHFEIVFWPAAMDAKYADVAALPDDSIDVTLFSGGIRNSEHEELAHLLRRTSRLLVAFGSCASEGCIPGLANLSTTAELFDAAYEGVSTDNPDHLRPLTTWATPEGDLHLPAFAPRLRTLEQVVAVDYSVPGCPPETTRIAEVVGALIAGLDGREPLPPSGSVLGAGHSTVCDECTRVRHAKLITAFRRIQEVPRIDPELCLLEQGIPCNGPATRDGCGALCPAASAPCIGCYGPADGVLDYGARLLSAFASVVDASEPAEIETILDGLPDPVGQAYRFSLARSLLRGSRAATRAARMDEIHGQPQAAAPAAPADGDEVARPEVPAVTTPEPALAAAGGSRP
jgi:F420-non-reducing hydrogenase small subunit